jgi:toxin-antitoxin system PIN domain toxin
LIAVDTNILVYAHRRDSHFFARASVQLRALTTTRTSWAIPWPCLHEFLSIVTNLRAYSPPSTLAEATAQVDIWLESPTLIVIGESHEHWRYLQQLMQAGRITGGGTHDARIAAICLAHGVHELWSADRDFSRFPALKTRNPLVG